MGTQQSNDGAAKFFGTIGGDLQGLAGGLINTVSAPGNIANALAGYLNSPLSGITLPLIILGGLYVASQVLTKV